MSENNRAKTMRFLRYTLQRTGLSALSFLGAVTFVFFLTHYLPGNPIMVRAGVATQDSIDLIERQLGLDRPLGEQYVEYMKGLVQGDLGRSWVTNRPVLDDLKSRLPVSLELAVYGTLLSLLLGLPLGILAAVKQDTIVDHAARLIGALGVSTPAFWLGLILIYFFFFRLEWAAAPLGQLSYGIKEPETITGFLSIDLLLAGNLEGFRDAMAHLALPAITLAAVELPVVMRLTRATMIEVLQQDYITTARALGFPYWQIVLRDALQNSMVQILTVTGLIFAYLVAGSVLVERVFSWPGVGLYAYRALTNNDFSAIQAFIIVTTLTYILINWLSDVLYGIIDPRIRI
ncbi:MAG: ABC transporter permease [Chloroflexi bacterium]|nr:MAG: ABC transporter permease [Chloroflexota bacterium]